MSCYLLSFFSATQLAVMGSAASLWLETNAANSGFKYFSDSGVQLASGLQWFLLELKMNLLAQLQYFIAVLYLSTLSQYFVSATAAVQSNVLLSRKRNRTRPSWSFRLGSIYTELHSVLKWAGCNHTPSTVTTTIHLTSTDSLIKLPQHLGTDDRCLSRAQIKLMRRPYLCSGREDKAAPSSPRNK